MRMGTERKEGNEGREWVMKKGKLGGISIIRNLSTEKRFYEMK